MLFSRPYCFLLYLTCYYFLLQSIQHIKRKNVLTLSTEGSIESLNIHPRDISLCDYRGMTHDTTFISFFFCNECKRAEGDEARIGVLFAHRDQWWFTQRRRLHLYKKSSPGEIFVLNR